MNRELQRALLEMMRDEYPNGLSSIDGLSGQHSDEDITRSLFYLLDHGLCELRTTESTSGMHITSTPKITARGLDFLEEDGGLSAILGVVVVKLHADTVRDLIEARITASDLPPAKRAELLEGVKKLPSTVLQAGTSDLVRMGLEHAPDAVLWISRLLGL